MREFEIFYGVPDLFGGTDEYSVSCKVYEVGENRVSIVIGDDEPIETEMHGVSDMYKILTEIACKLSGDRLCSLQIIDRGLAK